MQTLNYREREILKLRYGLADGYAYTLEEVGRIFQLPVSEFDRSKARQFESSSILDEARLSPASSMASIQTCLSKKVLRNRRAKLGRLRDGSMAVDKGGEEGDWLLRRR